MKITDKRSGARYGDLLNGATFMYGHRVAIKTDEENRHGMRWACILNDGGMVPLPADERVTLVNVEAVLS